MMGCNVVYTVMWYTLVGANVLVGHCASLLMSPTVEVASRWFIAALVPMYQTSRRHISKDLKLSNDGCKNFISHKYYFP